MKTLTKTLMIAAISLFIAFAPRTLPAQVHFNFQVFYDNLRPYGTWVDYPHYGFVWVPDAGRDFTPYLTNGHWIYTEYGWTWASYYDWGWAPFHYGRWDYDDYYGWFWIPGDEWGPAWVVWSRSDDYYGWTPLKPGISINLVYSGRYNIPHNHWIFVRDRDFEDEHIWRHHINHRDNVRIIEHSRIIHNTYRDEHQNERYFSGPDKDDVQRVVGRPVRRMAVHNNDKPYQRIENDRVYMYKPEIKNDNAEAGRRATPQTYKRWESPNTAPRQNEKTYSAPQQTAPRSNQDNNRRFDQQNQQQQPTERHVNQNSERRENVERNNAPAQSQVKREPTSNTRQEVKRDNNQRENSNSNSNSNSNRDRRR